MIRFLAAPSLLLAIEFLFQHFVYYSYSIYKLNDNEKISLLN